MLTPNSKSFILREANPDDMPLLMELIRELAAYEKISHEVKTNEEMLKEAIFTNKVAHALMAEYEGAPAGYILYFFSFSSFLGLPGLYLEDIYIRPEYRGRGFGKASLAYLARLAVEKNCWGMEWTVLDWNKPSIGFYEELGAVNRGGWLIYRLKGEELSRLALTAHPEVAGQS